MNHVKRIYRSTEAELIQEADDFLYTMELDKDKLATFGITDFTRITLKGLRDALSNTSTDAVMQKRVAMATSDKDALEAKLQEAIRQQVGRALIYWGEDDINYRVYNVQMVSKMTGDDLVRVGRTVKLILDEQLPDLAAAGLTQLMIDNLNDLVVALDKSINVQLEAIRRRDYEVDVRVTAGNAVYKFMKPISKSGKLCFEKVSPAKANDYNLTHRRSKRSVQVIEGEVAAIAGVSTTVMDSKATTSLEIKNTGTGPLHFFYAENITDTNGPGEAVIAAGTSLTILASSLGYKKYSRQRLNVFNPGPDDGSYRIEWR